MSVNVSVKVDGLDKIISNLGQVNSAEFDMRIGRALGQSIAMAQTESARRTPVDTGLLRSSIGAEANAGEQGFAYVRGLTAGVGTNVKYAKKVHDGHARHKIGENKFMEKGAKASLEAIGKIFKYHFDELARAIIR